MVPSDEVMINSPDPEAALPPLAVVLRLESVKLNSTGKLDRSEPPETLK